jgi:hypothetical protein
MADTHLLRNNAIVRNASVGATPPHGPVKTGELPLVHVKQPPAGPQVQEGQQRPVSILPPKDAESAVKTGGLPMVKVKMVDGKAKADDGHDSPVVIRDNRQTVAAGNLPMVQVKMENGRPQVQNVPNVQAGPPQIPGAAPALSPQRAAVPAQTSYALPRAPHVQSVAPQMQSTAVALGQPRVVRVAAPRLAASLPEVPELTTEQWMLFHHLAEKYLAELRAVAPQAADAPAEASEESDAVKFAAATLSMIDDAMVAIAVRAEAAALAASAPAPAPAPVANAYVAPRPVTGGHFSPASLAPQVPRHAGYVAQRPGGRSQGNAAMAPRGVQRRSQQPGAAPLPTVIVEMNGRQPVVQQQPAVDQASPVAAADVSTASEAASAVNEPTQG